MTELTFHTEFITLGQALKILGIAFTGGEAKQILSDGGVSVNGEEEFRRGRKLRDGDLLALPTDPPSTVKLVQVPIVLDECEE